VHLVASLAAHGWHPAAWRMTGKAGFEGAAPFRAMARTAERGGLDAVLLGLPTLARTEHSRSVDGLHLDPLPLLGAMIAATRHIGLCGYWPADIAEPFHVARVFATLDHLAGGRTGWIAGLAGPDELAQHFQRLDLPTSGPDAEARLVELIDVARQLWDSWEDGSFVVDQSTATFSDSEKVRPIDHAGRFFTVRGPLNVPRPVQGQPVILYRDRPSAPVVPGVEIVLADCAMIADAKIRRAEWQAVGPVQLIARVMPVLAETEAAAAKRAADLDVLVPSAGKPALRFVGTPQKFATWMAEWHAAGACDGFDILPAVSTVDLDLVVDAVVPLLRQQGLRPAGYSGSTLRDLLGLKRPASRFAA
jgi:alkanesulfonate monooxygenase SsuD/methylene tetrahydromethanopterin reductase-like flavin-dependent oxidoreductase (luciferase family)